MSFVFFYKLYHLVTSSLSYLFLVVKTCWLRYFTNYTTLLLIFTSSSFLVFFSHQNPINFYNLKLIKLIFLTDHAQQSVWACFFDHIYFFPDRCKNKEREPFCKIPLLFLFLKSFQLNEYSCEEWLLIFVMFWLVVDLGCILRWYLMRLEFWLRIRDFGWDLLLLLVLTVASLVFFSDTLKVTDTLMRTMLFLLHG